MKIYIFFNTEPNTNILGLHPIMRAFWSKEMEEFAGYRLPNFVYELEDGVFNAGCSRKEWETMAKVLFKRFEQDHSFSDQVTSLLETRGQKLYDVCWQTIGEELDTEEKKKRILKLFKMYTDICVPGLIAPVIEFGIGGMSNKMAEILKTKDLESLGTSVSQALALLAQPGKATWTEEARDAVYELSQLVYENNKEIIGLEDKLEEYIDDWGWVYYGYCGPKYTANNLKEEIQNILEKDTSPNEQLNRLRIDFCDKLKGQEELINKLGLTEDEKFIVLAGQDFGYTKAYRANLMALVNFVINDLLLEFTKQEGYSLKQFGVCMLGEMIDYLEGKAKLPSVDILNSRLEYCVLITSPKKDVLPHGDEAREWVKNNIEVEEVDIGVTELVGTVACSGDEDKIIGIASVVLKPNELKKVRDGDIMVSTTTIPEYVSAMRRARAVITETGGLTCHAAIVSREMGKPCIIGIKHLTKIIKDGEQIEVNLNKGIVKRIKF